MQYSESNREFHQYNPNGNKLGGGKRAHRSSVVCPQKFYQEPSNAVQKKIQSAGITCLPGLAAVKKQHCQDQKISRRRNQLGRQQLHTCRGKASFREGHPEKTLGFSSVTAACQETADPAEPLRQGNGRRQKIKIFQKYQILFLTVKDRGQNSCDNTAIDHKAFRTQDLHGRFQKAVKFYDHIQKLGAQKSADHAQNSNVDHCLIIHRLSPCPPDAQSDAGEHTHGDHQPIAMHGKGTYGK